MGRDICAHVTRGGFCGIGGWRREYTRLLARDRWIILYIKGRDKRRRRTSAAAAARISLSLRLLDRACRSRRDRFIHFARCSESCARNIMRFFARPRLRPIQRKTAAARRPHDARSIASSS